MVSSIGFKLAQNKLVTGFGVRRRAPVKRGRGIVRNIASAGTRALGNFLVNKLANVIAGSGRKRTVRRRKTVSGSSYKPSGYGLKARKPRKTLTRRPRRILF